MLGPEHQGDATSPGEQIIAGSTSSYIRIVSLPQRREEDKDTRMWEGRTGGQEKVEGYPDEFQAGAALEGIARAMHQRGYEDL
jgi:hypothetical protein